MYRSPLATDRLDKTSVTTSRAQRGGNLPLVLGALTLLAVVIAAELPSAAQVPTPQAPPTQAAPPRLPTPAVAIPKTTSVDLPPQAQADKEWLTAYFLVHQGYKLHHMDAIDATLNKMTPTQLHTLREMYDQKHSLMMQQQQAFNQLNALKVSQAQAWDQRQQQQMSQISSEETQSANLSQQQINQMHQEAAANAEAKNQSYPGMYGPYGSPYGGYVHPWFNPLSGY